MSIPDIWGVLYFIIPFTTQSWWDYTVEVLQTHSWLYDSNNAVVYSSSVFSYFMWQHFAHAVLSSLQKGQRDVVYNNTVSC
jgi:hypothetical protein